MVQLRIHETQSTEAREVEEHNTGADAVRIVPLGLGLVRVEGHGDRGVGAEGAEVRPELGGVGDEEGVGVDEDGARDGRGEDLVDEELHQPGCVRAVSMAWAREVRALTDAGGVVGVDGALAVDAGDHALAGDAVEADEDVMLGVLEEREAFLEVLLCGLVADDVEL